MRRVLTLTTLAAAALLGGCATPEPWVKPLVEAYQNDVVKAEFDRVYKGTGISAY